MWSDPVVAGLHACVEIFLGARAQIYECQERFDGLERKRSRELEPELAQLSKRKKEKLSEINKLEDKSSNEVSCNHSQQEQKWGYQKHHEGLDIIQGCAYFNIKKC